MYICICNAIRERELSEMARQHGGCAETLYARLGHAVQCGQCLDDATDIVQDARESCRDHASEGCFALAAAS